METDAILVQVTDAKRKRLKEVEIIASGYEFDCPKCDAYNTLIAVPPYRAVVECRSCHARFVIGEVYEARD